MAGNTFPSPGYIELILNSNCVPSVLHSRKNVVFLEAISRSKLAFSVPLVIQMFLLKVYAMCFSRPS